MRLTKPVTDYLIYTKPVGVDAFITGGKIYDFNNNEITNKKLLFRFEKILAVSLQTQGLYSGVVGTLADPSKIVKCTPLLYIEDSFIPDNIYFFAYDIIFPYFSTDNPFWNRFDITKKTIGNINSCVCIDLIKLKDFSKFKDLVKQHFNSYNNNRYSSLIIFDKDGFYHSGSKQSFYDHCEKVSFELSPSQKYRSHVKKIFPVKTELPEGRIVKIAESIETRFKNKIIKVPVTSQNYILRRSLWEHRKELKKMPFIFEGIYYDYPDSNEFEILGIRYSKFIL